MNLPYQIFRFMTRCLLGIFFLPVRIRGERHLAAVRGPVIVVANHQSNLDPPLLILLRSREVHFMAKRELFSVPVFGWICRKVRAVPVHRGAGDHQAVKHVLDYLSAGEAVVLFPEGTRSRTGRLQPGRPGVALMAMRSRATVVPMAIDGSFDVLPPGVWVPRQNTIKMTIGPAIDFSEEYRRGLPEERNEQRTLLDTMTERMMESIARLKGEPPPPPFRTREAEPVTDRS